MAKVGAREMEQLLLPKFDYYLDKSDPDVVILRRQDGAFVAAFSARGATREGIVEAAKDEPDSPSPVPNPKPYMLWCCIKMGHGG
jgi:hypothetical protein